MGAPLEDYKPLGVGTGKAIFPQHRPERYLWLIFWSVLMVNSVWTLFYFPARFPYHNIVSATELVAFAGLLVTGLTRNVRARRLTHRQH